MVGILTLDLIVIGTASVIVLIVTGHGGTVAAGRLVVSVTSVQNPLTIALLALVARSALPEIPFLGIRRLTLPQFSTRALRWWTSQHERAALLTIADASRIVWVVMCGSFAVKLMNIVLHHGFWVGDDVEIHEMTFAACLGCHWQAWQLRSSF